MSNTPISEIPAIRDTLRASFRKGLTRPLEWRKHQLLQLARMLQENVDVFAEALHKDLGKPKFEAYAYEIGVMIERSVDSAKRVDEWAKPVVVDAQYVLCSRSVRIRVSLFEGTGNGLCSPRSTRHLSGTVLIIAPWNYPLALTLQPLIGAIAAGCCAVIKPSEIASHFAAALAEMLAKYLDSNAYRVVLGAVPETTKLLELQWDHIFYTGNLGGKSPVLVDPSFDVTIAAKRILGAKMQNGGQLCVSPDYVIVPRTHQDALVSALKNTYAEFYPQGSLVSDSISRIVSPDHHSRLMDLLNRSKSEVVDVQPEDSLMEG
ncbi:Aldehyde/histidinol dehydrogenase [Favolaschia claudopus]|uniref:Aldehyde/histidinol dehydrogenase n=1 Tax=Favolaschia claudopus TaxID=2862362 RepID=A0AAW0BNH5_9AGAR